MVEPWRKAADARIREHRMADAVIVVRDRDGHPLEGVRVEWEMTRHAFQWGSQVDARLLDEAEGGDPYKQRLLELFNTAVFGNDAKWKYFERLDWRERTGRATRWLQQQGIRLRGHTMLWQTFKYGVPMPEDVERAIQEGGEANRAYVRRRVEQRLRNAAAQTRGIVHSWDVVNEQVSEHEITKFLTPETPVVSPLLAEWFRVVRQSNPHAQLIINDFHILVGDFKGHKDQYEAIIRSMLEWGAPLDAIGFQGHFHAAKLMRTPAELWQTLERFGQFGLPMLVTELDCFGGGWGETAEERDRAQAEFLEEFIITLFSHPQVEAIVFWGYWDERHWARNAPFFEEDWTPKRFYQLYRDLVFGQWWSEGSAQSDGHGRVEARVFKGDYRLTFRYDGTVRTVSVRIHEPSRFDFYWRD